MASPETKTVLGRVFTWNTAADWWECHTLHGTVILTEMSENEPSLRWRAQFDHDFALWGMIGTELGPTEADAILALQRTLRKMAELEVAE